MGPRQYKKYLLHNLIRHGDASVQAVLTAKVSSVMGLPQYKQYLLHNFIRHGVPSVQEVIA